MTITADRAQVNQDQNQIDLMRQRRYPARPATRRTQPLRIRTEALTVLPDEDIVKTDKPVADDTGRDLRDRHRHGRQQRRRSRSTWTDAASIIMPRRASANRAPT